MARLLESSVIADKVHSAADGSARTWQQPGPIIGTDSGKAGNPLPPA